MPLSAFAFECLLKRVSDGETVTKICEDPGMPDRNELYRILNKEENEPLKARYTQAMSMHADALFDEMVITAREEKDVMRAKLIIDTLKWRIARLKPEYNEKHQVNHDHKHSGGVNFHVVDRFIET